MHAGLGLYFQNLEGRHTDAEVFQHELACVEGRGRSASTPSGPPSTTSPTTCSRPNPPQFLSWVAGRTERVSLGTMVTVLPWHEPVRVAENFTLLDHLSGGRAVLGLGRGLGRIEFEGFRAEMGESRQRFTEYTEAIVQALETGVMEYDGELYKQPPRRIRPEPYASFRAARSPPPSPGVDGPHGPARGRPDGHRPEAVGHGRGGAGRLPPAVRRAERDRGAQARSSCVWPGCPRPRTRPSGSATSTSSATPAPPSTTTSSTNTGWPTSRGTSTTGRWPRTSRSTASRSSTASSPTSRSGAPPTRCAERSSTT